MLLGIRAGKAAEVHPGKRRRGAAASLAPFRAAALRARRLPRSAARWPGRMRSPPYLPGAAPASSRTRPSSSRQVRRSPERRQSHRAGTPRIVRVGPSSVNGAPRPRSAIQSRARARAAGDGSHVHRATDRRGRRPADAPAASPRLRRSSSPWPPRRSMEVGFGVDRHRDEDDGHALHPGPHPPGWSRYHVYEALTLVPLVRLLVSLAGPAPSASTGASRPCWGCFPPSPASPGSGCPQLHQPAATG